MEELRQMLLSGGACLVGYADLGSLPADARGGMPFGISLAAALDKRILEATLNGPTVELRAEYNRASELLKGLHARAAAVLAEKGYQALRADELPGGYDKPAMTSRLTHKMVATLAGLGWIGKSGLLVTRRFGSAVRLWSILTDAPLACDRPVSESSCAEDCRLCAEACPSKAIVGQTWRAGTERSELVDAFACRQMAQQLAEKLGLVNPTCGKCIAVCPWTRRFVQAKSQET